jgi:hypothetical protein
MPTAREVHEVTKNYLGSLTGERLRLVEKIAQTDQAPTQSDFNDLKNLHTAIEAFTAAVAQQAYELKGPPATEIPASWPA